MHALSRWAFTTIASALVAGDVWAAEIRIDFDHPAAQKATTEIAPQPGDSVSVKIANTCPDFFKYQAISLARHTPTPKAQKAPLACQGDEQKRWLANNGYCVMQDKTLTFVHAKDTDVYKVQVLRREPTSTPKEIRGITKNMLAEINESAACTAPKTWAGKTKRLSEQIYIVSVIQTPWALGMSGGLTISQVTDPVFAIVNDPNSLAMPPESIVIQDSGAEDSRALGFAGFVHLHNRNWTVFDIGIAPTFGLGVAEQNTLSGFMGVALTAGNIGYVNLGWNWRQVDRLPAGQRIGQSPINENVLADLPKRVDDGFFLSFSFRFMSPGESFFKEKIVTEPDKVDGN